MTTPFELSIWVLRDTPTHQNLSTHYKVMHRSAKFQTPPNAVYLLRSCEGLWRGLSFVFSRPECHLTFTWQYNPNILDLNWQCTVINDHDWQLRNGPLSREAKCWRTDARTKKPEPKSPHAVCIKLWLCFCALHIEAN